MIPALGSWRQDDYKFKAILGYLGNLSYVRLWLREYAAALAVDPSLVLSTYVRCSHPPVTLAPEDSMPSSGLTDTALLRIVHPTVQTHMHADSSN